MQRQVLATLAYSHVFRFPLTSEEVFKRLITVAVTDNSQPHTSLLSEDAKITLAAVSRVLRELVKEGVVTTHKGYFSLLPLPELKDAVIARQKKSEIAKQKWQEASFVGRVLSTVPGIIGVAVTGSLAVSNPASPEDDIDFLIVTRPHMMWLARPIVIAIAFVFGKRRSWQGEEQNSWCFNAWMTTESLSLSTVYDDFKPNLYHAYELLQASWIVDKGVGGTTLKQVILEKNPWVTHFLSPKRWWKGYKQNPTRQGKKDTTDLFARVLSSLNSFFYFLQLQYMKPHMTSERVAEQVAFFHPRPTRKTTLTDWTTTYKSVSTTQTNSVEPWYLPPQADNVLKKAKEKGKKVVLVTGVFDLLHKEHKAFLRKAKQAGDVLLVGLESDVRVRVIKGEGRPINPQSSRLKAVAELKYVDAAFVLPETFASPADHVALIERIKPDILAVSSHTAHQDKKRAIVVRFGGELKVVHQHNPAVSTTLMLVSRR